MKNQISNLGTALNKAEQKSINGGRKQCILPWGDGTCSDYGRHCAELECQLGPF